MDWLRVLFDRMTPTLLLSASVTLLSTGVLPYAESAFGVRRTQQPATADPLSSQSTSRLTQQPTPKLDAAPVPTITEFASPPSARPTERSTRDATPWPRRAPIPPPQLQLQRTQAPGERGLASRIRIASMGIDLPVVPSDLVVRGNRDFYPLCDVAMFLRSFAKPGHNGTTYVYAHARRGMFLPLLRASKVRDGASMLGALVEIYTTDNKLHVYRIVRVKRHATDLSLTNVPPGVHQLVLQTSEGYSGHPPKLQIAARPISVVPARAREATPRPHPRVCLPR